MDDDGHDEQEDDDDHDDDEEEEEEDDDSEDEDEDDDDDDDEDDDAAAAAADDDDGERKIMKWMLRRRRRRRRKTDPKSRKHTLCELAQSKCTWTFDKSHFVWEIYCKNAGPQSRGYTFCASARSRNAHGHCKFVWKFTGKMPDTDSGASILCEPAQPKRTWAFHKSHFCMEIYTKNAPRAGYHLDQTPGLNPHRKNPFSVATLFGERSR